MLASRRLKVRSVRGFSLLEAVVALSIFSASTVALYSWYGTVMLGLARADEHLHAAEFYRNFESHLAMQNLTSESVGEYAANGMTAYWTASLVEPKHEGRNIAGQMGYYRIGLYRVDAELFRDDVDVPVERISTRLVGYERVRVPQVLPQ